MDVQLEPIYVMPTATTAAKPTAMDYLLLVPMAIIAIICLTYLLSVALWALPSLIKLGFALIVISGLLYIFRFASGNIHDTYERV